MNRFTQLIAGFALAFFATEFIFAQEYPCPLGNGCSNTRWDHEEIGGRYSPRYDINTIECVGNACPYAERLQQQSPSWLNSPGGQHNQFYSGVDQSRQRSRYEMPRAYDLRSPRNQFSIDRDRDRNRYDLRKDVSPRMPLDSQSRFDQLREMNRGTNFDRPLSSGPPNTFEPSRNDRRTPRDDFQAHQHDENCNHDHGSSLRPNEFFDRRPSDRDTPRYLHPAREPSRSNDRPITDGPPPLQPQG